MSKKSKQEHDNLIALNKKARHDYQIEQRFEAGMALEGWEVKAIRERRVQLKDSYVVIKQAEAWVIGIHISPLKTASAHITTDPLRTRKLLLNKKELRTLIGAVQRQGYTLTTLSLYWKKNKIKLEIALAKGKKTYDKRETQKQRDWEREKQRTLKVH